MAKAIELGLSKEYKLDLDSFDKEMYNLYLFLDANMVYRINNIMKMYNDSYEDAIKNIKKSDLARKKYYESIFNLCWDDSSKYDLVIDTSIGAIESVNLIINKLNGTRFITK